MKFKISSNSFIFNDMYVYIIFIFINLNRLAEVCLEKGDYPKGLECIDNIEKDEQITPQNKIRAMILLSQIMCASVSSESGIVGVNSLVLLNTALELAIKNHLSYYKALIKMHLANIQVTKLVNIFFYDLKLHILLLLSIFILIFSVNNGYANFSIKFSRGSNYANFSAWRIL